MAHRNFLDNILPPVAVSLPELRNLHNTRRSTAPDSWRFFVPALPRGNNHLPLIVRLRGSYVHVQAARLKAWLPNLVWGFEPPESARFETVRSPAIPIATQGAQK